MTRLRSAALIALGVVTAVTLARSPIDAQQAAQGRDAGAAGQAPAGRGAAPAGRGAAAGRGAPLGVARDPLGDGPWVFDTAEQHRLKLVSIARGLVNPWSLRLPARWLDARHRDGPVVCASSATACSIPSRSKACPRWRRSGCAA